MGLALAVGTLGDDANMDDQMEDSTVSPIAELALMDSEHKTSTERPPTAATKAQNKTAAVKSEQPKDAQPHTVADFIIHPLIAFKPHSSEEDAAGKQAGDSSSTTPSPWTLFGFTAGQGLGSSVSSLAGSVSGWLTDRIQLPGLVDSPVRESTTTSTTTTTTTTPRPDVIVRVQHRDSTRRPPLISINNQNRPQRFHNNNNIGLDDEDDDDLDDQFEEEEEDIIINKNKRRNNKQKFNKRRPNFAEEDIDDAEEEGDRPVSRPQRRRPQQKRRPVVEDEFSEEEDDESLSAELDDEDDENVEEEESNENDDEEDEEYLNQRPLRRRPQINNNNRLRQQQQRRRPQSGGIVRRIPKPTADEEIEEDAVDEHFYYGSQSGRPSTKRSQNEATFFQRGQENIIKQIRQLTRGRTPAEIGALVRKSPKQGGSKPTQPQKATLLINRNGQTVYLAPELLNDDLSLVSPQYLKQGATHFPQPPLSKPLKRKDAPTQYITIPWSKLGISPPNQLQAVAADVQTQPLILNIPASAIQTMQNQSLKRKKQPVITAEAVPLLAEASIMDIFKPPKIPNDRHTTNLSASKTKPNAGSNTVGSAILPQRIRPGTIVEKAPASADSQQEASEEMSSQETVRKVENEYILVGDDTEPGLTRQVKPVYGEARHGHGANGTPYLELLKHGHFALHRGGRELELPADSESTDTQVQQGVDEKLIPVQIINEPEAVAPPKEVQPPVETQPQSEPQITQSEPQEQVQQPVLEGAGVAIEANKGSEPVLAA
ncbi:uncharacterized protein LOC128857601 [Anastrepha ludens]|uniref:uncharacterized protein LOC128857601 n=1 Tax=Anastrepha ludens TaxID=28586 RepID=UPI0023AF0029|nr:uncharacterized protein LOC128857601 [Anastrepha ludens]